MDFVTFLEGPYRAYDRSIQEFRGTTFALVRGPEERSLFVSQSLPEFSGDPLSQDGLLCPLTFENAQVLTQVFPWLSPRRLPEGTSFGFGDRLGLATPGHIRALGDKKIFPIFAQQSVRENARTERTFKDVLADAVFGVFQEGYKGGFGADADHLTTVETALEAAAAGYTFFTCDPSEHVIATESLSEEVINANFEALPEAEDWRREYLDRDVFVEGVERLRFSQAKLAHAGVRYGRAIRHAAVMYHALDKVLPEGFDYEVSVDETENPTNPLEHLFIAKELHRRGVCFSSLAPRFIGAMEKGVDWRGDFDAFTASLRAHAAIAHTLGPYRLSLHSGSDKFSIYRAFVEETKGCCHVKTAGTSYLVALQVVARRKPDLFRRIAHLSLERFSEDRASYALSANASRIPSLESFSDEDLPDLVEQFDSRQVLHVAYGSVLRSPLKKELRRTLAEAEKEYGNALAKHLGEHLRLLEVKNDA
jgi:hypothetical protein